MENDNLNVDGLSEILYKMYESIAVYKAKESELSQDALREIKKVEVYALLWAARIDVIICFNIIKRGVKKYEGCFFINIAFLKMHEIMKSLLEITTKSDNPLFYNPHPESKKEIVRICNEWKKQYGNWIKTKRNHSTAHYHHSFYEYINDGYSQIDPTKNQDCFLFFYNSLNAILDNIRRYDPSNLRCIDVEKFNN